MKERRPRLRVRLRFLLALGGLGLLLLVQPLLYFLGVALVVQLEQAGEDFTAGGFADRVADALLRRMEAVAEVEVGPTVVGGYGVVHLDVELTEFLDVGTGFIGVVETIVGLCQSLIFPTHQAASVCVNLLCDGIQCGTRQGKRKCLKCISQTICWIVLQA